MSQDVLTVWRCPVHGFRGKVVTAVGPANASHTYCAEIIGRDRKCLETVERLEVVPVHRSEGEAA